MSDITIAPQIISFNDVFKGTSDRKILKFISKKGFPQKIDHISSSNKYITVLVNKKNSVGRTVFFDVILSPDTPLGNIDEQITVTTNETLDAERRIKVTGKIVGDVQVKPDNLNFGLVNGKNSEKIIKIKNYNKGKLLQIKRIVSQKGGVITKLVTIAKGKEYMILVKPVEPAPDKSASINDTLAIYTDSRLQPVIEINIAGNYSENYMDSEY